MSHLNHRGHEVDDELLERQVVCETCAAANKPYGPYELQWDADDDIHCPACKSQLISPEDRKAWTDNLERLFTEKDIIAFQRPTELSHLRLMKKAKKMGKKIVQVCDDDYLNVPEWNTGYRYYTERRAIIEETLRICDAIDVTTLYLKELYSKYCDRVEILPNSCDGELIDVTPPMPEFVMFDRKGHRLSMEQYQEMRAGNKLILWGGSPTHEKDLELIVGACRRLSRTEKVVFAMVGYAHRALLEVVPKERLILFSLIPCMQYYMLYKGISPDIGLAPVCDVPFNRGKSNLKALEYQFIRTLPVVSDFVTYQGSTPRGFYAQNDERGWFTAMRNAVNCNDLEERLTENRMFVGEHYDIKNTVVKWEEFYGSLL